MFTSPANGLPGFMLKKRSEMFGPLTTWTLIASSGGGGMRMFESSTPGSMAGTVNVGSSPRSRGSVITPRSAVAAAVVGLQRYT